MLARVSLAALALVPLHLAVQGALPQSLATWRAFAVMAFLNNVIPFSLIVTGQSLITAGLASIINATTPLFTFAVMAAAGQERVLGHKIAGLVLGLAGVAILRGGDLLARDQQLVGILLCLGAAFSYGLAGFWAKRRLTGVPALTSATCQLLCSSLMMLPLAAGFGNIASLATASGRAWLSLLAFALLSTALAYVVFFKIVTRSGPFAVMLVTMLIPVSAIAMGAAFLGEPVATREIAGAIVISLALLLIDGRVLGRLGRSRPA